MAKAVSCACGWHAHGTEEGLVDAFIRHAEEGHEQEDFPRAGRVPDPGKVQPLTPAGLSSRRGGS